MTPPDGSDPTPSPGSRWGILGGTFDPIHLGHLVTARDAAEALRLEGILLVPAGVPPHKQGGVVATPELRLRMVEAAVEGDPLFRVEPLEVEREGPSFTVDTLRTLAARWAGVEWFLLMGTDQWKTFGAWREPEEVARLATVAVMTREGEDPARMDSARRFPHEGVAVTRMDISSSELRARIRTGRSVRYLVPPAVEALLTRHGQVYGAPRPGTHDTEQGARIGGPGTQQNGKEA